MSNEATGADARPASLDAGPLGYLALGLTLLSYGVLQTGVLSGTGSPTPQGLAHLSAGSPCSSPGSGSSAPATASAARPSRAWAPSGHLGGRSRRRRRRKARGRPVPAALDPAGADPRGGELALRAVQPGRLRPADALPAAAAIGTFAGSGGLVKAAGWVAAVSGLISWYWATAALTNSGWGRAALPVK